MDNKEKEAKWYVLNVQSGYEAVAKQNLEVVIKKYNLEDRIFDIVIPIECQLSKVNIAKEVREACKKESEKYNVVINFDENYID